MTMDASTMRCTQPEAWLHLVKIVGGTTAVTKVHGVGVTVTYIGTGIVDFVWRENPGTLMGATFGFQATTVAGVAGYTATFGVFNTTTRTLRVNIGGAAGVLVDLAALQWLNAIFVFKGTAV